MCYFASRSRRIVLALYRNLDFIAKLNINKLQKIVVEIEFLSRNYVTLNLKRSLPLRFAKIANMYLGMTLRNLLSEYNSNSFCFSL